MRTFVMGDLHGAYRALQQCLERSAFNKEEDCLIQLGDVADGHAAVYSCVEELLTIKNLIAIQGNHDEWFANYLQTGFHPDNWRQGGAATATSYFKAMNKAPSIIPATDGYQVALNPADISETHHAFFRTQHLYYIDDHNNCFVHAGFNREEAFKGQSAETYLWDRKLWQAAVSFNATQRGFKKAKFKMATPFNEVFIGHTCTQNWNTDKPMHAANIWNMDTGAGHAGRLSIMNVATKEIWQSDPVSELYTPLHW